MSFHSATVDWKKLAKVAKTDVDRVVRQSTLDVFTAVIDKTPVDTGRFRANWNCSQGEPDASTTPGNDQSRANVEANKALGFAAGGVVWFTNGLPYGPRLEYEGWSKQAPNGMIRVTIAEFDQYVKKAISG